MKKLPVITVDEWLQAEEEYREKVLRPKPKGSMTAAEYADQMGLSVKGAQTRLKNMHDTGVISREKWNNGLGINAYVYFLNKKK